MRDAKNNYDYKFFICLSIFWIIIGWGAYLLALVGFFYWWSISLFIAIVTAFGARFLFSNLFKASKYFLLFNLFFIVTAIIFTYFSTPTIFSGRDQASISQAAIRLSQNGKLTFSNSVSKDFFDINNIQKDKTKNCLIDNLNDFQNIGFLKLKYYQAYCQASSATKALNFPGFYYTIDGALITQFPIAYIAWLSLFYLFLGLPGLTVANGLLLYFFFLTFYFLIDAFNKKRDEAKTRLTTQILGMFILISSFSFMWFSKFTLTENMATPLIWMGILATIKLTSARIEKLKDRQLELWLFFLSLGLLIFTRIEGLVFFILALLILFLHKNSKKYFKKNFIKIILPSLILLATIFILNLFIDIYFYKAILKATLENIHETPNDLNTGNNLTAIFNLFKIFGVYGIIAPLFFGTLGILYLIKNKHYNKLIPLLIILPSLFYILSPQITPEHPWMLRRFTFSILPAFIFYSIILINEFLRKKDKAPGILILIIIASLNLNIFIRYITFIPGENLIQETQSLSQNFSNKDLILVDQLASGDKFEMIADPLNSVFDKNAVYFFNPQDLAKIDKTKYERIYLIVPDSKIDYYEKTSLWKDMFFIKNYSLNSTKLSLDTLPKKEKLITNGSIFEIIQ